MSQWGAYGYAKHGWTYDAILAHYYTGTTLGPAPRLDRASAARSEGKKTSLDSVVTVERHRRDGHEGARSTREP